MRATGRAVHSDPATGGHGIYLVFWFGDGRVQSPPLGSRPTNPDELKEFLAASLTESERRRISVLVVDVSPAGVRHLRPSLDPAMRFWRLSGWC